MPTVYDTSPATARPRRTRRKADRTRRPPLFDAGWLFLISGLLLLASAVMIPAGLDLDRAHWRRDRVLLTEMHRLHRLTRHEAYLEALWEGDEAVIYQLAATQLGLGRSDTEIVNLPDSGPTASTSVFRSLEPSPIDLPAFEPTDSTLSRLVTAERSRLWVIAGGAFLVLIGLLPPSITTRGQKPRAD